MSAKYPDIKLKELDEKIKQLQAQRQDFLNKVKEAERKKRTKNLIEIGGTMNTIGMTNVKQANAFKEKLSSNPQFLNWFNGIMKEFVQTNPSDDNKLNDSQIKDNTQGGLENE